MARGNSCRCACRASSLAPEHDAEHEPDACSHADRGPGIFLHAVIDLLPRCLHALARLAQRLLGASAHLLDALTGLPSGRLEQFLRVHHDGAQILHQLVACPFHCVSLRRKIESVVDFGSLARRLSSRAFHGFSINLPAGWPLTWIKPQHSTAGTLVSWPRIPPTSRANGASPTAGWF